MNFDDAFARLIGHEGGYVNDPRDPGGETKYGISKRSYPDEDIAGLTLDRAKAIYRRDFWDRVRCDEMPAVIRFDLFDMAVNSGNRFAVRTLQQALNVAADGLLGPITLRAANEGNPYQLKAKLCGHRLQFMTDLPTWATFGKGWARRIASNLKES